MKKIYVCGPTVYDTPHIGNMRPILTFDIYIRALRSLGQEVNFIHNITDIDDKIINKAKEQNTTEEAIANKYASEYFDLLNKFNIQKPTSMPTVLDNMDKIVNFIQKLIDKGFAYESNGNVLFDTSKLSNYGKISNRKLDEMQYENTEGKKHPADFALWKNTNEGIKFKSNWADGRPGWHTECALFISEGFNGESLDIHGGGIDLLFPHHENENAQFNALHDKDIANAWKHIGHLFVDGEKMSKSIGNIWSANDFINKVGADELRYIFLTSNVTSPLDLTEELIESSKSQVKKLKRFFNLSQIYTSIDNEKNITEKIAALAADWKFAELNRELNEVLKSFNKDKNETTATQILSVLKLLGFKFSTEKLSQEVINDYRTWEKLRDEKKYEEADQIRNKLSKFDLV